MEDNKQLLGTCIEAARRGGRVLSQWRAELAVREKAPADLVTEADLASQRAIEELIADRYPDHEFLGEEGSGSSAGANSEQPAPASGYRWIVDPLDGTTNFVHGLAQYSVSVAVERNGELLAGAVLDPCADELYAALRGGGAALNDQPIQASRTQALGESLVAVSLPARVSEDSPDIQRMLRSIQACRAIRRLGSAALNLCYVAAGRLDGYWATSVKSWDVAAGALLVAEAGGVITSLTGDPLDLERPALVAAATPELHHELRELVDVK